jgi:hypothetical protein
MSEAERSVVAGPCPVKADEEIAVPMLIVEFTVTGSIGKRYRALLDDTANPMPEKLTQLLEVLEGSRRQANCSCGAGAG